MTCSWLLESLVLFQCFLHAHLTTNNKVIPDPSQSNFKCRLPSSGKFRFGSQAHEILGYNWIHATRSSSQSATILNFMNDSLYVYPLLPPAQPCASSNFVSDCYCMFRVTIVSSPNQNLYVPLEPSPSGAHIVCYRLPR